MKNIEIKEKQARERNRLYRELSVNIGGLRMSSSGEFVCPYCNLEQSVLNEYAEEMTHLGEMERFW